MSDVAHFQVIQTVVLKHFEKIYCCSLDVGDESTVLLVKVTVLASFAFSCYSQQLQ